MRGPGLVNRLDETVELHLAMSAFLDQVKASTGIDVVRHRIELNNVELAEEAVARLSCSYIHDEWGIELLVVVVLAITLAELGDEHRFLQLRVTPCNSLWQLCREGNVRRADSRADN